MSGFGKASWATVTSPYVRLNSRIEDTANIRTIQDLPLPNFQDTPQNRMLHGLNVSLIPAPFQRLIIVWKTLLAVNIDGTQNRRLAFEVWAVSHGADVVTTEGADEATIGSGTQFFDLLERHLVAGR
ncbi:hypothetical protein BDW22DRAFT_1344191 [Trametopsis cervina]|nr:hypothetical protein BDW22DRAFT_1344191 [Trametopsis cervina]